jgi:uncharacterized protein YndB with AHSA1/START domain
VNEYTATARVSADPDDVFRLLTSPARLPEWNRAIVRVIDAPNTLAAGSAWVVEMHALGQSWPSRSTVLALDPHARQFDYRSRTDDGNPSYANWGWHVTDAPEGCEVTVSVALHPATFWRRILLAKIRGRQLRRQELPESMRAIASAVATVSSP